MRIIRRKLIIMKGNYRDLAHNKKVNYENYDGFNLKLNTNKEQ